MNYERILVPVDGSERALDAIGPARRFARLWDAPIWLVTVVPTPGDRPDAEARLARLDESLPERCERAVLLGEDPGLALARLDRQHPEALVCLASAGHRGVRRALFGSVAAQVVLHSDQVVAVVGPSCVVEVDDPIARLVVCLDGTPDAEEILGWAVAWSESADLALSLCRVTYPTQPPEARIPPTPDELEELAYVTRLRVRLEAEGHAVDDVTIAHPSPPEALVDLVSGDRSALIALATSSPQPLAELLGTGTASRVVAASTTPVLVASHPGAVREPADFHHSK